MRQISETTGVCFFRIQAPGSLGQFLREGADFSPLPVRVDPACLSEWMEYGCVYVDGQRVREPEFLLRPDQVLRVHTRRKHYAFDQTVPLRDRVMEQNDEFLVLDKPAGLPTHPTLDNFIDNAKVRLERELGLPLYTTHRLDVPTQGLLILAKTPRAQVILNRCFAEGRVGKFYRALTETAVPLGVHTHFMNPESRVPKEISRHETDQWWRCQLEVESCLPWGPLWATQVRLLTGKTHQIRAQLRALGAPIVGDVIYGGRIVASGERMALECFQLNLTFRSRTFTFTRPNSILTSACLDWQ